MKRLWKSLRLLLLAAVVAAQMPAMAGDIDFSNYSDAALLELYETAKEKAEARGLIEAEESSDGGERIECDGYDSPEEALGAYLEYFKDADLDGMLSCFAMETYTDNFSLARHIERMGRYSMNNTYLLHVSDYSEMLDLEYRRREVNDSIRYQYMTLMEYPTMTGESAGTSIAVESDVVEEFIEENFKQDDRWIFETLEFDGVFIDPAVLVEKYDDEHTQRVMAKTAVCLGADEIRSVVAFLEINGSKYMLCADAASYGGKWYLYYLGGTIGSILGISSYEGGLISTDEFQW